MNNSTDLPPPQPPLPITITPGLRVVSVDDNATGKIVGITQAFCVYMLKDTVCVDRWRHLALAGVYPAAPLLPSTVSDNDRLDASARLLRELALLKSLGDLSPAQATVMEELMSVLCPSQGDNTES